MTANGQSPQMKPDRLLNDAVRGRNLSRASTNGLKASSRQTSSAGPDYLALTTPAEECWL